MSWVKNREEFKQAALSTARAVSKNHNLESTSQASSRPPSSSQISLHYPPRSSSQIDMWRGEGDFQAFWHTFHKEYPSLKMPKIARDFFAELELSRVEMVGGEKYPGARININSYLNTQAKRGIDNKVPPFNPLAANLWLKQLNGETLQEESKNTVNAFLSSTPVNIDEIGKKLIKAQNSQEDFQSIVIDLMRDLDLMNEPETTGDQESLEDDPAPEEAIQILAAEYVNSNYDIGSVMRSLLNSKHFKESFYQKVKSPAEVVASVIRLVGDYQEPKPGLIDIAYESKYMGQELLNPPTVEGWHTGKEWIDSGSLVGRVNFASDQLGDLDKEGVKDIVSRISSSVSYLTAEQLVDGCLDLVGPLVLEDKTRSTLVDKARTAGDIDLSSSGNAGNIEDRVSEMLQLIVATREFQFA